MGVVANTAKLILLPLGLVLTACANDTEADRVDSPTDGPTAQSSQPLQYPETSSVDQTDEFHGVSVKDPYRWLEADIRNSQEVAEWVKTQSAFADDYLSGLPMREAFRKTLTKFMNYEKFMLPVQAGDYLFYRRNDGLENQFQLYVEEPGKQARVLLDPNSWSADGATALGEYAPSPDGAFVAYTVQDGGSDWRTIKVIETATGKVLNDDIAWVKFSGIDWAKDGSGFFYSRYPEPAEGQAFQSANLNQAVFFHKIGDAQSADEKIYARPDEPEHGFSAAVSSDGATLVVTVWKGTDEKYEVVLIDLIDRAAAPVDLIEGFKADYSYFSTIEGIHYFRTDDGAPRGRILAYSVADGAWSEIVPQGAGVLTGANILSDKLVVGYLEDVKSVIRLYRLDGAAAGEVDLPGVGSAGGFLGEPDDKVTYYAFESFNRAPTIYRYDVTTGQQSVFKQADTEFDPDDYLVEQVFYSSKDGARIPMFITRRKDVAGNAPTLLYGYGGFNISLTPSFAATRLAWLEAGGVYAVANLRGGGEYGKDWHNAGRLLNKQNVFDDFIAAGEYLIAEGVTTKEQLSILGGSNGGLLVGAVVNQRPGLFGAAAPVVGVMDMLRYHRFTAGRFWIDDYGDPDEEAHFRNLYGYSPYHNIRDGEDYPAILVVTADTDDRVVPSHSFKYAAALQAANIGDEPHLIRIETRAGHGAGKPTDKVIEEYADIWAFLAAHTGLAPAGKN